MASPFSTFELAFTISYCIYCWCFLTPLLLYYVHQFYRLRRTPIIFKRHYRIVIVINIVISAYIIVSRPSLIIAVLYGAIEPRTHNCFNTTSECSVWQTTADTSAVLTQHGWTSLLALRMWLIFFETAYNEEVSKGKWTQFIDPTSVELQNKHWAFRFRNTFGKERWLLCCVFAPIYLCLVGFNMHILVHSSFRFDEVLYIPTMLVIIILLCKTSRYSDVLKMRHEMRLLLRCIACDVLCSAIYFVLWFFTTSYERRVYLIYGFGILMPLLQTGYALCTTKWVLSYSGLYTPGSTQLMMFMHSTSTSKKAYSSSKRPKSLSDLLSKTETLHLFMKYLCNEWSMEALLCVIECCQFKKYIQNNHKGTSDSLFEDTTGLRLPTESLPRSVIVYDSELSVMEKMQRIVDKYIRTDGEFEVNIGHQCRENLMRMRDDGEMSDSDLYQCFDELLNDLLNLMQDSYFRFVNEGGLPHKPSLSDRETISSQMTQSNSPPLPNACQ
eukprot:262428_1